jgi:hypothetical protein
MLFALVYWLLRRLIGLAVGSLGSRHNDVEVLVLRHQLAVLTQSFRRWRFEQARSRTFRAVATTGQRRQVHLDVVTLPARQMRQGCDNDLTAGR